MVHICERLHIINCASKIAKVCTVYDRCVVVVVVKIAANCVMLCLSYNRLYFGVTSTGTQSRRYI